MVSDGKVENQAGASDSIKELLLKSLHSGTTSHTSISLITLLIVGEPNWTVAILMLCLTHN